MSSQPPPRSPSPSPTTTESTLVDDQPSLPDEKIVPADEEAPPIPMASAIEKLPPRPAPTYEYSWAEWSPNAEVVYLRDAEETNKHLSQLKPGCLGFDLEWKPNYVKGGKENPVALVQLANDDVIYLLQITAMKEFPSKLREILEDRTFLKAGVGIQGDTKKLFTDWSVSVRGCVDLSLLARTVDNARWKGKYNSSIGLARLVEVYCYRLLGKGKITRSNWELPLKPPQQDYASNDAHGGYMVYKHLMAMVNPQNPPEAKHYTFDCDRGYYCEPSGVPWTPENPNYNPGPLPPPRPPRDDKRRRKGPAEEPQATHGEEAQQWDPRAFVQRHESVLKIAHSTMLRQQDAAERLSGRRPGPFHHHVQFPQPFYMNPPPPPQYHSYHHHQPVRHASPSYGGHAPHPMHRNPQHPQALRSHQNSPTPGTSFHHAQQGRNSPSKPPASADPAPAAHVPPPPPTPPPTRSEPTSPRSEKRQRSHYRPRRPKAPAAKATAAAQV